MTTRTVRRSLRLVLLLPLVGCVYYNGIYNAQVAERRGDQRLRQDDETGAAGFYQQAAASADSVLVRHPRSVWRVRALYLAGRSGALAGQCDSAVVRLADFLREAPATDPGRPAARLALATCDFRSGALTTARARIDSLLPAAAPALVPQLRLWGARAALAQGDRDAVVAYLGDAEGGRLPWELLAASLAARELARAESLLVQRAQRDDFRDDAVRGVRDLWAAGAAAGALRVVAAYDGARVRAVQKGALHFAVGDLLLRAGRDTVARPHLEVAERLAGRDTVLRAEAAARLAFLPVPTMTTVATLDSIVASQDSAVLRTAHARRVIEQALWVRLLLRQEDPTGGARFLAAEVARDSLRAPRLAVTLLTQLARELPTSPVAPLAWHAAGLLWPDSLAAWHRRVTEEYPLSAVAAQLRGDDPAERPDFVTTPQLLRFQWLESARLWADSVRKLRQGAGRAASPAAGRSP
jgi:hypothetical protein